MGVLAFDDLVCHSLYFTFHPRHLLLLHLWRENGSAVYYRSYSVFWRHHNAFVCRASRGCGRRRFELPSRSRPLFLCCASNRGCKLDDAPNARNRLHADYEIIQLDLDCSYWLLYTYQMGRDRPVTLRDDLVRRVGPHVGRRLRVTPLRSDGHVLRKLEGTAGDSESHGLILSK